MVSVFLIVFCAFFTPSLNHIVQKRDVTDLMDQIGYLPIEVERTQKASGRTGLNFIEFEYEWTIENISIFRNMAPKNNIYIKSPIFEVKTPIGTYLWSIKLIKLIDDYEREKIQIYLNLESEINDVILTSFSFTDKTSSAYTESVSYNFDKNSKSNGAQFQDSRYSNNYGNSESSIYKIPSNINNTLIILLKGKCTVSTEFLDTLITNDLNNAKKNLSLKAVEEILHFLYTGQATNSINLQKGLLLTSGNLELKEQYEEKMFSELKIENAAEIYKFLYLHGKTDLKKKVMEFIKENGAAVMATKGWISILGSSDIPMLAEIFSAFVNNSPRSNIGVPENSEVIATEKSPQEIS